jgi:glycosyltransferase involved in cell wall biosynthesis
MITFSICIPTYPPHFKFINDIILNINNFITTEDFTVKEVIIAASETETVLINTQCKYPVIVDSTLEKCNASKNRNRGWERSTGDWIVFLDSDDCFHIEKLLVTYKIISQTTDIDCVLHSYDMLTNNNKQTMSNSIDTFIIVDSDEVFNCTFPNKTWENRSLYNGGHCLKTLHSFPIHHGIITIRRNQHIRFDERISLVEDAYFCYHIALQKKVAVTNAVLMLYTPPIIGYNK